MTWARCSGALALAVTVLAGVVTAAEIRVHDTATLRAALSSAKPDTRVLLQPGDYTGGVHIAELRGEPGRPIVIAAADPKQPPVFTRANTGLHLSNPAHVELRDLVFTRLAQNGLNLDDGSHASTNVSVRDIRLIGLRISDIGGDGNHDGIKLSGVHEFLVEDCTIERWGTRGGSAIDMVGCHRGTIRNNTIRHVEPAPPNCTGVQAKGGSSEIAVLGNRFESAGGRGVNIGGSTGLAYFRPPVRDGGEHAEARAIRVEGNTFVGGIAAVAFVGVDGATVRFNTIERPARWAVRILQENRGAGFVPSRNGVFSDNVVIFASARAVETAVNVGAGAAPETFRFARNRWLCPEQPERSRPALPTAELDGHYGEAVTMARDTAGAEAWKDR
jgi:hypothetical protein